MWRSIGFVLSVNAPTAILWIVLVLGSSAVSLLGVINTAPLLDELVRAIASKSFTVTALATSSSVQRAAALICSGSAIRYLRAACETRLGVETADALSLAVYSQAASSSLERCEQADFHDRFARARGETSARPLAVVESFGHMLQGVVLLTGLAFVLAEVSPVLIGAIGLAVLPPVIASIRSGTRQHMLWLQDTSLRRRSARLGDLLVSREAAAEIRTRGIGQTLVNEGAAIREAISQRRLMHFRIGQIEAGAAEIVSALVVLATAAWLLRVGSLAAVSVGGAAMVFQAFFRASGTLSGILLSLSSVRVNALYLSELFGFLDQEGSSSSPEAKATFHAHGDFSSALDVAAVTFRHPGADRDTLRDVSFVCQPGSFTVVVGRNGAGKSTLLRVVAGVYRPTAGAVRMFGRDVVGCPDRERIFLIGFQHQEPVRYPGTFLDNVTIAPTGVRPSDLQIKTAIAISGSKKLVDDLPSGLSTPIGKDFANATELSSGQWQRLSLARAVCFEPQMLLLDEPTSSLDGEAERNLVKQLAVRPRGQTLLVASHSRTIVEASDQVVVLDNGRVVAVGAPRILAESCDAYRSLFGRD